MLSPINQCRSARAGNRRGKDAVGTPPALADPGGQPYIAVRSISCARSLSDRRLSVKKVDVKSGGRSVSKDSRGGYAPGASQYGRALKKRVSTKDAGPRGPSIDYSRSPFSVIEASLSPSGVPVLGLHLHVAHMHLLDS